MAKATRRKAYVYCVHDSRLLVFGHPDFPPGQLGLQVPGGSIRDGEAPEAEAPRELIEETGRDAFCIERLVGQATCDIGPYRPEIQERWFFLARPTGDRPERRIAHEHHDGTVPMTRLSFFWIPLKSAHVLQAGLGALAGALTAEEASPGSPPWSLI